MFKRMQKLSDKLDKSRSKGERHEEQGPPELAMDEESSSESSSSGSSEESESEEEGEKPSGTAEADGTASEADSREEGEGGSSDSAAESSSSDASSSSAAKFDVLQPSIGKAMEEPIYIPPGAPTKQGFPHRSCYLCPQAVLKNEKMIKTHLASGVRTPREASSVVRLTRPSTLVPCPPSQTLPQARRGAQGRGEA